jgi:glucose-6-phosphate 1-dehydrogenase
MVPKQGRRVPCQERTSDADYVRCAGYSFGATGALAHKKIFPALQRLAKRGKLEIPVSGSSPDQANSLR